jgi:hypothetical protein
MESFAFQFFHNEISMYSFAFSLTIKVPKACQYIQGIIFAHMPVHVSLPEYRSGFLKRILALSANLKFSVKYLIELCWSNILPKIE